MELSTAKALDTQQRKLLGSVRGLSGMMRLAARAAEGLNRSMSAYDAQAPERLNKSVERMERAVQRLVDPMTEAASSLADMNAAIRETSGRLAGMTKHMSAMQLTARASATASVSGSSPALAAAVGSDKQDQKKQIEDKVKKDVLPAFARVGEMLTSAIPIFELNQKVEQASGENKLSDQQEKSEKQAAGEETARMQASKAVETASKAMAAVEKSTQVKEEKESGNQLVNTADLVDKALNEFKTSEQQEKSEKQAASEETAQMQASKVVETASRAMAVVEKSTQAKEEKESGNQLVNTADLVDKALNEFKTSEQAKPAVNSDVDRGESLAKLAADASKAAASAEKTKQVKQTSQNNADQEGKLAKTVEVAAKAISEQEKAQQRKQMEMSVKSTEQQASREAVANNALTANNVAGSTAPTTGVMNNSGQAVPNVAPMPNLKDQVAGLNQAFNLFMTQNAAVSAFVVDNWGAFEHVYKGVNAAISAYNTLQLISRAYTVLVTVAQQGQQLATLGLKNAWAAMNATMKANVFILIASAIVGIVMALISLWKTNDQFAAFFIRIWHWILGFVDQIPIFFLGMVEGVLNVFKRFSEIISKFFGWFYQKFQGLIEIYNEIFDKDFKLPSPESVEDWADGNLQVVRALKVGMEGVAAKKAADNEAELAKFLKDREDARNKEAEAEQPLNAGMPAVAQAEAVVVGGGRLDEVGRVNDTVEINSEDLKTMRELAELKNIQNFVTLTPSVNVQTGDIRNGMDVSSMVQAITVVLQEEIAASAEGVYA
ncbi:hypothetical protein [Paenibacillus sp. PAMC21692]|uniref:hypothetical protein n=1 Tax=Paenibacillus sp. PAMC21692 TaxID=2762320 RepID=UPI00164DABDE|nr:hypothetical protein [Paenibacillus sp. PAMC21692]QNK57549.1 hypothetical protein H7F31_00765 [Paenibacillus sp. PAMC21692]